MISTSPNPSRGLQAAEVACLLIVLALQLALSARWVLLATVYAFYRYVKKPGVGLAGFD